MDTDKVVNKISKELLASLKAMKKAKSPEEKKMYSEIVKNLSESLEVFQGCVNDLVLIDRDDSHIPF